MGVHLAQNFLEHIHSDPRIMSGEAVMKGTRVGLRTLLANLGAEQPVDEILRQYPSLTQSHIQAAIAFAAHTAHNALMYRRAPGEQRVPSHSSEITDEHGNLLTRVTTDPTIMQGVPCIRHTRIPVYVVLDALAAGMDHQTLLSTYPTLEAGDISAALACGAELVRASDRLRDAR